MNSSSVFPAITVDISAQQAADDALRAAQADLSRVSRLTTVGAMAVSIAHEINQPLASIIMNGNAGLRWLARSEPNLEEVRASLGRIVNDGPILTRYRHRAAQIIAGIRAMFRKESICPSAARSLSPMVVGYRLRPFSPMAQCFRSCSRPETGAAAGTGRGTCVPY
jgi:C4-dicarboxylate-specific signal transduction histidine kinase